MKYALIVRSGSVTGGKYYNDYINGGVLTFDDDIKAEKFAARIEEGSSKTVWVEVVPYENNRELPNLLSENFINTIGKKMNSYIKD